MDVTVEPATADRWNDLAAVFGSKGDPSWCWCQFFLTTGQGYTEGAVENRSALEAQLRDSPVPPGLLAYVDGEPAGWLQLGRRSGFPRLADNRALLHVAPDDDESLWRTTCFVVRVGYRRQGISTALLDAAIDFARSHGATQLEGNPVDTVARGKPSAGAILYHGVLSTFLAAGFTEIGRTTPIRPVVRKTLNG